MLIPTTFGRPGSLRRALEQGASGLLLKDAPAREEEVLIAAARHGSAAEIASALHLSEGTVRNYPSAAMRKLGARNRREAVAMATEKGWL